MLTTNGLEGVLSPGTVDIVFDHLEDFMKISRLCLLLLILCCNSAAAYNMPPTNWLVAFLYFQMAEEPLPVRSMMLSASRFDNEFERREFLDEQLVHWSVLVEKVEQKDTLVIKVDARVGEYDFANNYFPLNGIHEETYLTYRNPEGVYGPGLAVEILNSREFRHLKMEPGAARALSEQLGGDKGVSVQFVLRPVSTGHKDFSGGRTLSIYRALAMYAESATILHGDGETKLAVLQASSKLADHSPVERVATKLDASMLADPWAQAWGSREHFEALISHYNLESWSAFERIQVAGPCVNDFGYSDCQDLVERRRQLVLRCTNTLERDHLCWRIQGLPYTQAEADR